MKTRIRPFRLWWCMSGVWWMVLQRPTSLRACKSLGPSGMEWNIGLGTPHVRFSEETKMDALPMHTEDTSRLCPALLLFVVTWL